MSIALSFPESQSLGLHDLTVIVVTYNSAHCMAALAASLVEFSHVVLVDNASNDGSADAAEHLLPHAQVIRNPQNLGFGAANNRAIEVATTPWCLLLNPDCEISADKARTLLEVGRDNPDAAIVAPQLLRPSGAAEVNYRWPASHWRSLGPGAQGPCCVGFVCGAALLLNMAVMREIGLFDEQFFLYYEDDDLCTRVFNAGLQIIVAPQVRLVHASRGSVRGASPWRSEYVRGYHHAQSKIRFMQKHMGTPAALDLRRRTLWLAVLHLVLRHMLPSPKHLARAWGRFNGLRQFQLDRSLSR